MYMIDRLKYYSEKIKTLQTQIQEKLDNMEITDLNENISDNREEQISELDDIIEGFDDLIYLIDDYNCHWRGLKSIK